MGLPLHPRGVLTTGVHPSSLHLNPSCCVVGPCLQLIQSCGALTVTVRLWLHAARWVAKVHTVSRRRSSRGAGCRLAAVQLVRLRAASRGQTLRQIAATGVSAFTVRTALGRVRPGGRGPPGTAPTWVVCLASRTARRRPRKSGSRCCPIRCPRTGSGRWPAGACSARAPIRSSPRMPGTRWPGCCWPCPPWRPPGSWRPPGRLTHALPEAHRLLRRSQPAHGGPTAHAQQH
jgi:hypothetical protein